MSSSHLKTLWRIVEVTPTRDLLTLDDRQLLECLQTRVAEQQVLSVQERAHLRQYLHAHLLLIRDLADGRNSMPEAAAV